MKPAILGSIMDHFNSGEPTINNETNDEGKKSLLENSNDSDIVKQIKDFLNRNMYNHKKVLSNTNKGKVIIKDLFKYLSKNPKKYINKELFKSEQEERVIADFIAGMTDRYAINLHKKIL